MHFTKTTIITIATILSTANADLWLGGAKGMTPGCSGLWCAGVQETPQNGYVWHSGNADDVCEGARSAVSHEQSSGIGICEDDFEIDEDVCGGRAVFFKNCADIDDETIHTEGKHVADIHEKKTGKKIGECKFDSDNERDWTCPSWGSEHIVQTIRCATLGNKHKQC